MPENLLHSPLLGLALTIIVFHLGDLFAKRFNLTLLPPFLTASALLIMLLSVTTNFTYEDYMKGGSYVAFLLGPATISFALPLKRNWQTLKDNLGILLLTAVVGAVTAIIATYYCAILFGAQEATMLSLVPKSITTPIAMEVSSSLGGIPALTIVCVSLAGIVGAVLGHKLLALFGVTNDIAIGFGIGTGSHALGTSSCIPISSTQVTFGSLAIVLVAIITTIIAPHLLALLR